LVISHVIRRSINEQRVKMVRFLRGLFMLKITQAMHKNRVRLGKLAARENVDGRRRNVMRKRRGVCVLGVVPIM
jgi:hypothetical protein